MPVPAGPIPKTIVWLSIASTYRFWFSGLGSDRAPAVGQDVLREHLSGSLVAALAQHREGPLDDLGRERLTARDDGDQLLEEAQDDRDVALGSGRGDLVAASVQVDRGRNLFDRSQELVVGAEDADHRHRGRHRQRALDVVRHGPAPQGSPSRRLSLSRGTSSLIERPCSHRRGATRPATSELAPR